MAIDLTGANTYFGSSVHIKSEEWTKLLATRRTGAIAHAKIVIELFIGDNTLDTTVTTNANFPRHDAAVYEQALWMLQKQDTDAENRAIAIKENQGGSFANNISVALGSKGTIAPDAIRFLVQYPRVIRLVKG